MKLTNFFPKLAACWLADRELWTCLAAFWLNAAELFCGLASY